MANHTQKLPESHTVLLFSRIDLLKFVGPFQDLHINDTFFIIKECSYKLSFLMEITGHFCLRSRHV